MKLDELLKLAGSLARSQATSIPARDLARAVLDLLAEATPCGYAEPYVATDPATEERVVVVPDEWGGTGEPERARHMARMLLRAADEAEGA